MLKIYKFLLIVLSFSSARIFVQPARLQLIHHKADLSEVGGEGAVVFVSSFLNPSANQDGESIGVFASLSNGTIVIFSLIADINNVDGNLVQTSFTLRQNYPNPFHPSKVISFLIPKTENVTLKIYNILGYEITTLLSEELDVGNHQIDFNG